MTSLEQRQLIEQVAADGRVETKELDALEAAFGADGEISRSEADLLVELHKRIERKNPAFETFFYKLIKRHILTDGRIDADEAKWLRQMLFADGKIDEREKKFLREVKGEAKEVSPEFEALLKESMDAAF